MTFLNFFYGWGLIFSLLTLLNINSAHSALAKKHGAIKRRVHTSSKVSRSVKKRSSKVVTARQSRSRYVYPSRQRKSARVTTSTARRLAAQASLSPIFPTAPALPALQVAPYMQRMGSRGFTVQVNPNVSVAMPYYERAVQSVEHQASLYLGPSAPYTKLYARQAALGGNGVPDDDIDNGYPTAPLFYPVQAPKLAMPKIMLYATDIAYQEIKPLIKSAKDPIEQLCRTYFISEKDIQFNWIVQNMPYNLKGPETLQSIVTNMQYAPAGMPVFRPFNFVTGVPLNDDSYNGSYQQDCVMDVGLFSQDKRIRLGNNNGTFLKNKTYRIQDDKTREHNLIATGDMSPLTLPLEQHGRVMPNISFITIIALKERKTILGRGIPTQESWTEIGKKPKIVVTLHHILDEEVTVRWNSRFDLFRLAYDNPGVTFPQKMQGFRTLIGNLRSTSLDQALDQIIFTGNQI